MFTRLNAIFVVGQLRLFGIISISIHELFQVAHQAPLQTSNYRLPRSVFSTPRIFQPCQPFETAAATNVMHYSLSRLFDFRPFVTFFYRFHLSIDLYVAPMSSPLIHVPQLVPTSLPLPPTRRIQVQPMPLWTISPSMGFVSVDNSDLRRGTWNPGASEACGS
ncbi:hypothetical protein B0H14DRAFT_1063158 [Mycena olivaceomarginata]|nr:hypothetical protein B0H14DRAFT_1063158 [Mycena olivaceomarginata]